MSVDYSRYYYWLMELHCGVCDRFDLCYVYELWLPSVPFTMQFPKWWMPAHQCFLFRAPGKGTDIETAQCAYVLGLDKSVIIEFSPERYQDILWWSIFLVKILFFQILRPHALVVVSVPFLEAQKRDSQRSKFIRSSDLSSSLFIVEYPCRRSCQDHVLNASFFH